jgi:hypothetical protein
VTPNETTISPLDAARSALRDLAHHRSRPCLAIVGELDRAAVRALLSTIEKLEASTIDILVSGLGGDIEAAYLMARTLRRRFTIESAFVPYRAKSAATFLCLAADEIVLAELGELGPLDAQSPEGSALTPFKLLEQVADAVVSGIQRARPALQSGTGKGAGSPETVAIAEAMVRSVLSPIDALRLAEAARALEETEALCERLFRRYRHDLYSNSASIVRRLIHAYPCHGFPIDLEELNDLGLPARHATEQEATILERAATAFADPGVDFRLIEVAAPVEGAADVLSAA